MAFIHRCARARAFAFAATIVAVTLLLAMLAARAEAANFPPECHGTTMAVTPGGERTFSLRCRDFDGPQPPLVEIVDAPDHAAATVAERCATPPGSGCVRADAAADSLSAFII